MDTTYDDILYFLEQDPQLKQFAPPVLHRRQPRSAGFMLEGNPENVIYLLETKHRTKTVTFQWSSPAACQKIDEIKVDPNRPFASIINIQRLTSSWNRVRYS